MPDKIVPAKPKKYTVEEVSDEPVAKHASEPKEMKKTEELPEKEETPHEEKKVTSFSLMDAPLAEEKKPMAMEEKDEPKEELHESEPAESVLEPEEHHQDETSAHEELPAVEAEEVKTEDHDEIKQWLEHGPSESPSPSERSSGGKGKFVAIFLGILIIAALGGGIYYYRANVEDSGLPSSEVKTTEESPKTEETAATSTPTPTVAAIDLSKYKVQVLNGGGVAGEAGKAQGYLESIGFKNFKTGNASSFTYTDTQVAMKKDVPDEVFNKVKAQLEQYYQGVVKADKALDDKSEFDLQVTVGKKK